MTKKEVDIKIKELFKNYETVKKEKKAINKQIDILIKQNKKFDGCLNSMMQFMDSLLKYAKDLDSNRAA